VDEPCAYGGKAHRVQVGHVGTHALTITLQRSAESMRVDKGCKLGAWSSADARRTARLCLKAPLRNNVRGASQMSYQICCHRIGPNHCHIIPSANKACGQSMSSAKAIGIYWKWWAWWVYFAYRVWRGACGARTKCVGVSFV